MIAKRERHFDKEIAQNSQLQRPASHHALDICEPSVRHFFLFCTIIFFILSLVIHTTFCTVEYNDNKQLIHIHS